MHLNPPRLKRSSFHPGTRKTRTNTHVSSSQARNGAAESKIGGMGRMWNVKRATKSMREAVSRTLIVLKIFSFHCCCTRGARVWVKVFFENNPNCFLDKILLIDFFFSLYFEYKRPSSSRWLKTVSERRAEKLFGMKNAANGLDHIQSAASWRDQRSHNAFGSFMISVLFTWHQKYGKMFGFRVNNQKGRVHRRLTHSQSRPIYTFFFFFVVFSWQYQQNACIQMRFPPLVNSNSWTWPFTAVTNKRAS